MYRSIKLKVYMLIFFEILVRIYKGIVNIVKEELNGKS